MRCTIRWNPGHWPYITRCALDHGHEGDHEDKNGYRILNVPGQAEAEAE